MKKATAKRMSIALLSFVALHSLPAPVSYQRVVMAQAGVAIVTQMEGSVWMKRGNRTNTVERNTLLNVGDVVGVREGSRALIYQEYAPLTRLTSNQSRTIRKLSPPPPRNGLTAEEYKRLKRILLNAMLRKGVPSERPMGSPADEVLTLIGPRHSAVLRREPTFRWTRVNGAKRYEVNVFDRNQKIVWSANTTKTRLPYPKKRRPLAPGDYKCEVTAWLDDEATGDPKALLDTASFIVVSRKRAEEIEADLAAARDRVNDDDEAANLVYITALMQHKRLWQAAAELKESLERAPKDQTLWELLMETFAEMKLWRARESARRLSEDPNVTAKMIQELEARR